MIRNYLKIALRSLRKQKVYTFINITGLSIGIASCLLIVMFVRNEFSYDKFHAKADRIYKMVLERKYPNHATFYSVIPHSFGDVMVTDFPEIAQVVKIGGPFNNILVRYEKNKTDIKQFEENFVMAADSNFFKLFSIALRKGDPEKVLTKSTDLVVTEETARRYFANEDPIGKTLRMFEQDYVVTGVCENVPANSHFKFDLLCRWDERAFAGGRATNFTSFSVHLYLELKAGSDATALEAKFPKMVDTYAAAQIERDLGKSWEDYKKEGNGYRYFLQPLTSIHLDPLNIEAKMQPGGNLNYVYFLIGIAILILVIACINFMNLATARSAERAREVGVRKTMGSMKSQLIAQFLTESILISLFATVLAVGLIYTLLPSFNNLTGKQLILSLGLGDMLTLAGIAVVVGFLAGSYPAFVLSAFNPVVVMKGNFTTSAKGTWMRNGLVVFQFFISIVLIVGTMVVAEQMQYMQKRALGFDKEKMLVVERVFALRDQAQTYLDELQNITGVKGVGSSFNLPGRQGDFFGAQWQAEGSSEILTTKTMVMNDELASTLGFQFVEGKGYSKETNDSLSLILNETAVKTMELSDPVGRQVSQVQRTPQGNVTVVYTIVGVVKDFNFQSLRDPVTPLAIQSNESFGGGIGYVFIKVEGQNIPSVLNTAEEKWKKLAPDAPFKYLFLDENLNAQYANEQRAGKVFGVFSGLAILIACVGLFGLAAYTANLRTKEIGIRKVMGASVTGVVLLLTKDFTKLIAIAFLLAAPLGWYMMENWLAGFAYRIELGAGVFLLAGATAITIAWLTVSYQSIKAALMNPIKSLRNE